MNDGSKHDCKLCQWIGRDTVGMTGQVDDVDSAVCILQGESIASVTMRLSNFLTDAVTWLQDGLIATLESTGMIFHRFWYTGRCDIAIADRFDFEHIVSISYSVKGCVDSFEQSKDLLWLSGR